MVILTILLSVFIIDAKLPNGLEKATWGMTVEELQQVANIQKVHAGDGFGYAEHMEEDPDVYIRMTPDHNRIEYYFFEGRLYKIFIIYDKILYNSAFYQRLIDEMKEMYGLPHKSYEEKFFDLAIQHTLWEGESSKLDLRKGAGFVYQVRINKAVAREKTSKQKKKQGI